MKALGTNVDWKDCAFQVNGPGCPGCSAGIPYRRRAKTGNKQARLTTSATDFDAILESTRVNGFFGVAAKGHG